MSEFTNVFQHWFYTAFFAYIAWRFLTNPASYTSTCVYFAEIQTEGWAHDRIMQASMRRKQLENISPNLGYYLGVLSLALTGLCGASLTIGGTYLQLRNSQKRRVAVLSVRRPQNALPLCWVWAGALAALTPLVDLPYTELRFTAIVVTVASLTMTIIAWRIALMPALLENVDLPAEQFVDDRLRAARSTISLVLAAGAPFVYLAQTSVLPHGALHGLFEFLTLCAWFPFLLISLRLNRRGPGPSDLSGWTPQGAN